MEVSPDVVRRVAADLALECRLLHEVVADLSARNAALAAENEALAKQLQDAPPDSEPAADQVAEPAGADSGSAP